MISLMFLLSCENNLPKIEYNEDQHQDIEYHKNSSPFEYTVSNDRSAEEQTFRSRAIANVQYYDGTIYLFTDSMIYRYNAENGNVISLCADPLCYHNDSTCPFFGLNSAYNYYIDNDKIAYARVYSYRNPDTNEIRYIKERVQYEISTGKLTVIERIPDGIAVNSEFFKGDYRYFLNTLIDDDNNQTYEICRENMLTRKIESLKYLGEIPVGINYVSDDGRIYYPYMGYFHYFYEDEPDKDVILCEALYMSDVLCDGNYFYYVAKNDNNDIFSIQRYDMEMDNRVTICDDNPQNIYLTHKYIYYTKNEKVVIGIDKNGNAVELPSSDVYRVPIEGGDSELVYSFPDNMSNYSLSRFIVDGIYLYASYGWYDETTYIFHESINVKPYDFIRINLETGEIYYICE